jgi:hypothetical protein
MPTSTSTDPRPRLPYTGLAGDVLATARQATAAAAHTYLAGLDAVAGAQRRLVAGTPLAPVSEILGAQVKVTRRVLEDLVTGETPASPSAVADAVEQAAPAQKRPARRPAPKKPASRRRPSGTAKAAAAATAAPAKRTASAARKAASAPRAATSAAKKAAPAAAVTAPAEPFAGFAGLTAEQIIGRLPGLSQVALAEVRAYETAGDARRTVLDRIEELTAHEPLPGYDELTVEDILPRLADGGPALAARVLQYERRHKERAGVLEAAELHVAKD